MDNTFSDVGDVSFGSRRSPVVCLNGAVASSQQLATGVGMDVLRRGGNAADAAVAVAAALNVTEPCSCGIGGDAFALFYDAKTRKVTGLNGSGRAPAALTAERARADSGRDDHLPETSVHAVTVPGAPAAFADALERWGSGAMTLGEVLEPAARLADEGVPLGVVAALTFQAEAAKLAAQAAATGQDGRVPFLPGGRAPRAGQIVRNPELAETLRRLGRDGPSAGFYAGPAGEAIVGTLRDLGGVMTADDLAAHRSTFDDPISVVYRGVRVHEMPPAGQGIAALVALNIVEGALDASRDERGSAAHMHALIEAMRLAFADARAFVSDPTAPPPGGGDGRADWPPPVAGLLSKEYAASRRAATFDRARAAADVERGTPMSSSDTVQFVVVDAHGNACSFIYSNYTGFGSGIVARGCGFTLQSRGANFSLREGHPNLLAGGRRTYHTIIPLMLTDEASGELYAAAGVMGGFMQPQGHLQVCVNMIDYGLSPQGALDAPRFCVGVEDGAVYVEDSVDADTVRELRAMGHNIRVLSGKARAMFGRGQIVRRVVDESDPQRRAVLWCGSDPRADGCAMGY